MREESRQVAAALAFVAEHGVVLVSAKGPAPRLIDAIAGEAIAGNWWSHPRAREIYRVLAAVRDSGEVLVCRLVDDRLTLVHRRLWPALARLANAFTPRQIAQVVDEHTAKGHHAAHEVPFARWLPDDVAAAARALSDDNARSLVGRWLPRSPASPAADVRIAKAAPPRRGKARATGRG